MAHGGHWDAHKISERYERVKNDIIAMNLRNQKFLIRFVCIAMFVFITATFSIFFWQGSTEPWLFVVLIILVLITVLLVFLIINTSEKCVSKLTICSIVVDDKQVFLESISEVSCGGDAIKTFLQFCDKTTDIVKAAKGTE
ncbi:hypothetical protein QTP81_07595 [Alteromonas sp. ASW11-36]|uniref:Uncharacterized protein n=1 Tax=Alteromonas arenosi TaxID=3055817 RepID=A0ABT7SW91_9ALTE|nr:hypothetical protein [Alteromonas sp. ASW11-36]MDM7860456.1 hypothetical protein [Alteromonas sp. ASW11-36]